MRALCYAMMMGKREGLEGRGEREMLRRNKGREKAQASCLSGLAMLLKRVSERIPFTETLR